MGLGCTAPAYLLRTSIVAIESGWSVSTACREPLRESLYRCRHRKAMADSSLRSRCWLLGNTPGGRRGSRTSRGALRAGRVDGRQTPTKARQELETGRMPVALSGSVGRVCRLSARSASPRDCADCLQSAADFLTVDDPPTPSHRPYPARQLSARRTRSNRKLLPVLLDVEGRYYKRAFSNSNLQGHQDLHGVFSARNLSHMYGELIAYTNIPVRDIYAQGVASEYYQVQSG